MSDFEIEVGGKVYHGELLSFGYSYKIVIDVDGIPVTFEPDEERNFRAVVAAEHAERINNALLAEIASELEAQLK